MSTNQGPFSAADWALFCAISLIWGASFLFIDIGLEAFRPGLITLLRVASGAALLWLIPAARRPLQRVDRPRVVVLSFIWVALPFTIFPLAQQWVNSALTGMLNGAMPIFAALVATGLLRRVPRPVQLAGLLLGFVGVAAIAQSSAAAGGSRGRRRGADPGSHPVLRRGGEPRRPAAAALRLAAGDGAHAGAGLAVDGAVRPDRTDRVRFQLPSLLAVLAAGVIGTGAAYWIMGTLVGRVGSIRASFITYLIPVVALFLGVLLRGDRVGASAIAGVVLATAGALLAARRER